jgi:hypothetical protein
MKPKKLYPLIMAVMMLGGLTVASAQELGRKGERRNRYTIGLSIGNRSYLNSDFFDGNPEKIEPGDLRGNSYSVLLESTPNPLFGVEVQASLEPSSTEAASGNKHRLQPFIGRLSGKIHPLATTSLSRYFDFYVGGGATGISFDYEITGKGSDFSNSYKAFGPHAIAGFEYYLGTFSSGKWRWGAYVDYIFTSAKVERVVRSPKNSEDRQDFNAGGHLFTFGIKFNAVR